MCPLDFLEAEADSKTKRYIENEMAFEKAIKKKQGKEISFFV